MDTALEKEIRTAFTREYQEKASRTTIKGISGWFVRTTNKCIDTVGTWAKQNSWKMFPTVFIYAAALSAVANLLLIAPLVFVGLSCITGAIILDATRKINAIAQTELDRDIENGVLPARYKGEILQPQIEALEVKKSGLLATATAVTDFTSAASVEQPTISLQQPKSLSPACK